MNNSILQYRTYTRLKIIAFAMVIIFSVSSVLSAAPTASVSSGQVPLWVKSVSIPSEVGTIRERYRSEKDNAPCVVFIQDAHANYTAQKNIGAILSHVQKTYGVDTISLEGSEGPMDVSLYRAYPIHAIRDELIDAQVKAGIITGPEQFAICAPERVSLVGVEDESLYFDQVKTYAEFSSQKELRDRFLAVFQAYVQKANEQYLPQDVQEILSQQEACEKGEVEVLAFYRTVRKHADAAGVSVKNFPAIEKLTEIGRYQTAICPEKIETERAALMQAILMSYEDSAVACETVSGESNGEEATEEEKNIKAKIPAWFDYAHHTLSEIEGLQTGRDDTLKNMSFRATFSPGIFNDPTLLDTLAYAELEFNGKRMTPLAYYGLLKESARVCNIDFRAFENLNRYYHYLWLVDEADLSHLNGELSRLADRVSRKLCTTQDERQWYGLWQGAKLIEKLLCLTITPDEYRAFRKKHNRLTFNAYEAMFQSLKKDPLLPSFQEDGKNVFSNLIPLAETFYVQAAAREDAMVEGTLSQGKSKKEKVKSANYNHHNSGTPFDKGEYHTTSPLIKGGARRAGVVVTKGANKVMGVVSNNRIETPKILIAGGYHTPGITRRLKEKNISYVVVTPRIAQPEEGKALYETLMAGYHKYFGVHEGSRGGTLQIVSALAEYGEEYGISLSKDLQQTLVPQLVTKLAAHEESDRLIKEWNRRYVDGVIVKGTQTADVGFLKNKELLRALANEDADAVSQLMQQLEKGLIGDWYSLQENAGQTDVGFVDQKGLSLSGRIFIAVSMIADDWVKSNMLYWSLDSFKALFKNTQAFDDVINPVVDSALVALKKYQSIIAELGTVQAMNGRDYITRYQRVIDELQARCIMLVNILEEHYEVGVLKSDTEKKYFQETVDTFVSSVETLVPLFDARFEWALKGDTQYARVDIGRIITKMIPGVDLELLPDVYPQIETDRYMLEFSLRNIILSGAIYADDFDPASLDMTDPMAIMSALEANKVSVTAKERETTLDVQVSFPMSGLYRDMVSAYERSSHDVETDRAAGKKSVSSRDTFGPGISSNQEWEPVDFFFYDDLEVYNKRTYDAGVRLSLCRKIMEAYLNGVVTARVRRDEQGNVVETRFDILLPLPARVETAEDIAFKKLVHHELGHVKHRIGTIAQNAVDTLQELIAVVEKPDDKKRCMFLLEKITDMVASFKQTDEVRKSDVIRWSRILGWLETHRTIYVAQIKKNLSGDYYGVLEDADKACSSFVAFYKDRLEAALHGISEEYFDIQEVFTEELRKGNIDTLANDGIRKVVPVYGYKLGFISAVKDVINNVYVHAQPLTRALVQQKMRAGESIDLPQVHVTLGEENGTVVIRIRDTGDGLNVEAIRQNAVALLEKGVLDKESVFNVTGLRVEALGSLNGSTIDPDTAHAIMQLVFEKGFSRRYADDKEHGLGLWLTRETIRDYFHGTITARNYADGEVSGAEFEIRIPGVKEEGGNDAFVVSELIVALGLLSIAAIGAASHLLWLDSFDLTTYLLAVKNSISAYVGALFETVGAFVNAHLPIVPDHLPEGVLLAKIGAVEKEDDPDKKVSPATVGDDEFQKRVIDAIVHFYAQDKKVPVYRVIADDIGSTEHILKDFMADNGVRVWRAISGNEAYDAALRKHARERMLTAEGITTEDRVRRIATAIIALIREDDSLPTIEKIVQAIGWNATSYKEFMREHKKEVWACVFADQENGVRAKELYDERQVVEERFRDIAEYVESGFRYDDGIASFPSMQEMAQRFNVSQPMVSRYFSEKQYNGRTYDYGVWQYLYETTIHAELRRAVLYRMDPFLAVARYCERIAMYEKRMPKPKEIGLYFGVSEAAIRKFFTKKKYKGVEYRYGVRDFIEEERKRRKGLWEKDQVVAVFSIYVDFFYVNEKGRLIFPLRRMIQDYVETTPSKIQKTWKNVQKAACQKIVEERTGTVALQWAALRIIDPVMVACRTKDDLVKRKKDLHVEDDFIETHWPIVEGYWAAVAQGVLPDHDLSRAQRSSKFPDYDTAYAALSALPKYKQTMPWLFHNMRSLYDACLAFSIPLVPLVTDEVFPTAAVTFEALSAVPESMRTLALLDRPHDEGGIPQLAKRFLFFQLELFYDYSFTLPDAPSLPYPTKELAEQALFLRSYNKRSRAALDQTIAVGGNRALLRACEYFDIPLAQLRGRYATLAATYEALIAIPEENRRISWLQNARRWDLVDAYYRYRKELKEDYNLELPGYRNGAYDYMYKYKTREELETALKKVPADLLNLRSLRQYDWGAWAACRRFDYALPAGPEQGMVELPHVYDAFRDIVFKHSVELSHDEVSSMLEEFARTRDTDIRNTLVAYFYPHILYAIEKVPQGADPLVRKFIPWNWQEKNMVKVQSAIVSLIQALDDLASSYEGENDFDLELFGMSIIHEALLKASRDEGYEVNGVSIQHDSDNNPAAISSFSGFQFKKSEGAKKGPFGGGNETRMEDGLAEENGVQLDDMADQFRSLERITSGLREGDFGFLDDYGISFDTKPMFTPEEKQKIDEAIIAFLLARGMNQMISPFAVWMMGSLGNIGFARKGVADINLLILVDGDAYDAQSLVRIVHRAIGSGTVVTKEDGRYVLDVGKDNQYHDMIQNARDFVSLCDRFQLGNKENGLISIEVMSLEALDKDSRAIHRAQFHVVENIYQLGMNGRLCFESEKGFADRVREDMLAKVQESDYGFFMNDYLTYFLKEQVRKVIQAHQGILRSRSVVYSKSELQSVLAENECDVFIGDKIHVIRDGMVVRIALCDVIPEGIGEYYDLWQFLASVSKGCEIHIDDPELAKPDQRYALVDVQTDKLEECFIELAEKMNEQSLESEAGDDDVGESTFVAPKVIGTVSDQSILKNREGFSILTACTVLLGLCLAIGVALQYGDTFEVIKAVTWIVAHQWYLTGGGLAVFVFSILYERLHPKRKAGGAFELVRPKMGEPMRSTIRVDVLGHENPAKESVLGLIAAFDDLAFDAALAYVKKLRTIQLNSEHKEQVSGVLLQVFKKVVEHHARYDIMQTPVSDIVHALTYHLMDCIGRETLIRSDIFAHADSLDKRTFARLLHLYDPLSAGSHRPGDHLIHTGEEGYSLLEAIAALSVIAVIIVYFLMYGEQVNAWFYACMQGLVSEPVMAVITTIVLGLGIAGAVSNFFMTENESVFDRLNNELDFAIRDGRYEDALEILNYLGKLKAGRLKEGVSDTIHSFLVRRLKDVLWFLKGNRRMGFIGDDFGEIPGDDGVEDAVKEKALREIAVRLIDLIGYDTFHDHTLNNRVAELFRVPHKERMEELLEEYEKAMLARSSVKQKKGLFSGFVAEVVVRRRLQFDKEKIRPFFKASWQTIVWIVNLPSFVYDHIAGVAAPEPTKPDFAVILSTALADLGDAMTAYQLKKYKEMFTLLQSCAAHMERIRDEASSSEYKRIEDEVRGRLRIFVGDLAKLHYEQYGTFEKAGGFWIRMSALTLIDMIGRHKFNRIADTFSKVTDGNQLHEEILKQLLALYATHGKAVFDVLQKERGLKGYWYDYGDLIFFLAASLGLLVLWRLFIDNISSMKEMFHAVQGIVLSAVCVGSGAEVPKKAPDENQDYIYVLFARIEKARKDFLKEHPHHDTERTPSEWPRFFLKHVLSEATDNLRSAMQELIQWMESDAYNEHIYEEYDTIDLQRLNVIEQLSKKIRPFERLLFYEGVYCIDQKNGYLGFGVSRINGRYGEDCYFYGDYKRYDSDQFAHGGFDEHGDNACMSSFGSDQLLADFPTPYVSFYAYEKSLLDYVVKAQRTKVLIPYSYLVSLAHALDAKYDFSLGPVVKGIINRTLNFFLMKIGGFDVVNESGDARHETGLQTLTEYDLFSICSRGEEAIRDTFQFGLVWDLRESVGEYLAQVRKDHEKAPVVSAYVTRYHAESKDTLREKLQTAQTLFDEYVDACDVAGIEIANVDRAWAEFFRDTVAMELHGDFSSYLDTHLLPLLSEEKGDLTIFKRFETASQGLSPLQRFLFYVAAGYVRENDDGNMRVGNNLVSISGGCFQEEAWMREKSDYFMVEHDGRYFLKESLFHCFYFDEFPGEVELHFGIGYDGTEEDCQSMTGRGYALYCLYKAMQKNCNRVKNDPRFFVYPNKIVVLREAFLKFILVKMGFSFALGDLPFNEQRLKSILNAQGDTFKQLFEQDAKCIFDVEKMYQNEKMTTLKSGVKERTSSIAALIVSLLDKEDFAFARPVVERFMRKELVTYGEKDLYDSVLSALEIKERVDFSIERETTALVCDADFARQCMESDDETLLSAMALFQAKGLAAYEKLYVCVTASDIQDFLGYLSVEAYFGELQSTFSQYGISDTQLVMLDGVDDEDLESSLPNVLAELNTYAQVLVFASENENAFQYAISKPLSRTMGERFRLIHLSEDAPVLDYFIGDWVDVLHAYVRDAQKDSQISRAA